MGLLATFVRLEHPAAAASLVTLGTLALASLAGVRIGLRGGSAARDPDGAASGAVVGASVSAGFVVFELARILA